MTNDDELDLTPHEEAALPEGVAVAGEGENVCQTCGGSGEQDGQTCPECGGSGKVIEKIAGG
ncbi:MAG: hypothetical protein JWM31_3011 [Solirubrobacterales bacterium]|nr:hypothetical protein [Solirubrobacterales bacterium]